MRSSSVCWNALYAATHSLEFLARAIIAKRPRSCSSTVMIVVTRCLSGNASKRCRTCWWPRWWRLKWSVSGAHKVSGTIRFFDMYAENLASRQPIGYGGADLNNSVLFCFALSYTIRPTNRDRDVTIVRLLLNKNLVIHNSPRIQFTAHHRSNRTSGNKPGIEKEKGDRN